MLMVLYKSKRPIVYCTHLSSVAVVEVGRGGGGGARLMYGKEGPGSAYINQRDSFCVTAVNVFLRAI
jgi:hypothetical protein